LLAYVGQPLACGAYNGGGVAWRVVLCQALYPAAQPVLWGVPELLYVRRVINPPQNRVALGCCDGCWSCACPHCSDFTTSSPSPRAGERTAMVRLLLSPMLLLLLLLLPPLRR
jgi:hypothetical protein